MLVAMLCMTLHKLRSHIHDTSLVLCSDNLMIDGWGMSTYDNINVFTIIQQVTTDLLSHMYCHRVVLSVKYKFPSSSKSRSLGNFIGMLSMSLKITSA